MIESREFGVVRAVRVTMVVVLTPTGMYGDQGGVATTIAFELKHLAGPTPWKVHWGPFPTSIGETIGGTVGVARNERFAFGIQGLNLKTSAGARATDFGSALHARTQDRTRERIVSVGDVKDYRVLAMEGPDASLEGSRIRRSSLMDGP